MLEPEEAAQLGLAQECGLAVSGGVQLSFPIPDRGIPASATSMKAVIQQIIDALEAGQTVAVHCRPGIGRSGLIAIGALLLSGVALDRAIETVTAARGLPVPETEAQVAWLRQFASAEATLHT